MEFDNPDRTSEAYLQLVGQAPAARPLPTYTVATVPSAAQYPNCLIYVSNETGGAVPAFSDGTNWRRVTDRTVIVAA